jgi:cytochrome d ubiquinol oxidase subunit I
MAMSLAFHIIFAVIGIALPAMMTLAEWRWWRTRNEVYLALAKRWAKGTAIIFAVGAVSGTVLSFELGLLWPSFMSWSGSIIGLLFSLEGFAFFTEAIFLGIYLYGWGRVSESAHLVAGLVVTLSGVASAVFVVMANGWMNAPVGFRLEGGRPVEIDPLAALLNPHGFHESLHMVLAAFAATGFAVAGIHSALLLRDPQSAFHQRALALALLVGGLPSILQPVSGDVLAKRVAQDQPAKLAAFEGLFRTQHGAPFVIGGIPDMDGQSMRWGLEIPTGLSVLLYLDPHAEVTGLDAFPREDWPPVGVAHTAFQLMVAAGLAMMGVALWAAWQWRRCRSLAGSPWLLRAILAVSPLGMVAVEAGWVVTEVGRQPWIIYGVMRTSEAVTPMPGLTVPLVTFTTLYLLLAVVVVWLLARHIAATAKPK